MNDSTEPVPAANAVTRFLNTIEYLGNKLPDPAMLFLIAMLIVWAFSALLAPLEFSEIDPRTGEAIAVSSQLSGPALAHFLSNMVQTFTGFAPLGVVLVAMLGVGIAEHSGFINTALKQMLSVTPGQLLTPVLILVAIISHSAVDAGYVVVIPLGGIIFYSAGRHPLAGIAAAFAGVSGGFSANFVPSGIDPLLQGFTQSAAQIIAPEVLVNPLCNWFFTSASCLLIVGLGWYITDKIIEPKLAATSLDGEPDQMPEFEEVGVRERRAFRWASLSMLVGIGLLVAAVWPEDSPMRAPNGDLASFSAPLMRSIVPLIFLLFALPGVVYGFSAGIFRKAKDVVDAMNKAMQGLTYYIVMAFFCSLFIQAFADSNLGALIALKGAVWLKELAAPPQITITGIIFLTAAVNLLVGSASAKWALIAPIVVPMLMQVGISPELTQAAYRVGDSSTNIITPLMPYFPLVVVYCQRYVKGTGIGTLVAMMLPYALSFLVLWSLFLMLYWWLGIPLGLQASYAYPA